MASSFTWLDYSEQDRRKMLDVISLFREKSTRDELGIASIRDAFSDMFFPGISVIQTRARYFLLIPWIYQALIQRKTSSQQVGAKLRQKEVELINILADTEDSEGTIGKVARASLKRLPSNIYWFGLGSWKIRRFEGSQVDYHQDFDLLHRSERPTLHNDDGEMIDTLYSAWDPHLPPVPNNFPDNISFQLTVEEAEYLIDRISQRHPDTLLAFLVRQRDPLNFKGFVWDHPKSKKFSQLLQQQLYHAQTFSEVIQGAALLYNLMLAEEKQEERLCETYQVNLQQWALRLADRATDLHAWKRKDFWCLINNQVKPVSLKTKVFVDSWFDLALNPDTAVTIADNLEARNRIKDREATLKGKQSRLGNSRALELWQGDAGTAQLDFRWFTARQILNDILNGLSQEEADDYVAA